MLGLWGGREKGKAGGESGGGVSFGLKFVKKLKNGVSQIY